MKRVVIAGGDVGGANGLLPILDHLGAKNISIAVINQGYLGENLPERFLNDIEVLPSNVRILEDLFKNKEAGVYLFATGGWNTFPLQQARVARKYKVPVVYLLDSWSNYRMRMELDGLPTFYPDVYTIMDEVAFDGALSDGFPKSILKVTGHPALSSLAIEWDEWCASNKGKTINMPGEVSKKKLIIFVSEPVEYDQGSTEDSHIFRGYTEKTVIKILCEELQEYAREIRIGMMPHPREDPEETKKVWRKFHGKLEGGLFRPKNGREGIFFADGVSGMASILLYEAWLIGKPVLSLQPGVCRRDLYYLNTKIGCKFISEKQGNKEKFSDWMYEIIEKKHDSSHRLMELQHHRYAAQRVCHLLIELLSAS